MTDFLTPYGFVQAVAEIRDAGRTMWLYFDPDAYTCVARDGWRQQPMSVVEIGQYEALVLGDHLVEIMRKDLKAVITGRRKIEVRPCAFVANTSTRMGRWKRVRAKDQPKNRNARSYAKVYLSRGKLSKHECLLCGSLDTQIHHPHYDFPLHVVWLCEDCHFKLHHEPLTWTLPWSMFKYEVFHGEPTAHGLGSFESKAYDENADNAGRRSV